jgi:hypothetical protein
MILSGVQKYLALHNYFMANLAYVAEDDTMYIHWPPFKVPDAALKQKIVLLIMGFCRCKTWLNIVMSVKPLLRLSFYALLP